MYPVLFRIGDFEVTSFGVLVAIGALVGIWLFGRELARSGLPEEAANAAIVGVIGGFIGAKLLWTVEFAGEDSVTNLLFSRGGFSWFGGLLGGLSSGVWMLHRHRVPLIPALAAAAPVLAVGHAIGRIGCFLVGDDYGRPSDLPWAVAFPEGLPPTSVRVHPTQLYEAAALAVVAWALIRWRRRGVADTVVLGRYLVLAGSIRFAIEFIRVNLRILGPLTLAHLIALSLVVVGMLMMFRERTRSPSTAFNRRGVTDGKRRRMRDAGGPRQGSRQQSVQRKDLLLLFERVQDKVRRKPAPVREIAATGDP